MAAGSNDLSNLEAEVSRLETESDTRSSSERASDVYRLRSGLMDAGIAITSEDEKVFSLFIEGVLDSRHLADQFGARLLAMNPRGNNAI